MIKKLCIISSILLLIVAVKEYIPILADMKENQIITVQAADITDFIIENGILVKYNGIGSYVEIPENVTTIGRNAFSNCSSLVQVKIPKGVTVIEEAAFKDCNNLTDIEIPVSVTKIGRLVFSGCENLKEINIPAEVNEISYNTFEVCTSLTKINVSEDNITYCSQDGVLYSKSMNELICYPAGKQDNIFETPLETTIIGCGAFEFSKLKEIKISSRVEKIEHSAFFECDNLKNIELPENIKIIYLQTFYGCDNLESVKISSKVEKISMSAFNRCRNLKEIEIPSGVTEIQESVFYGCSSLVKLQIPNSVAVIGENILKNASNAVVYCESGSYAQKYAIENGYQYKIIEDGTTAISNDLSSNDMGTDDSSSDMGTDGNGHLKGVAYHTQEEIKSFLQLNGVLIGDSLIYLKDPEVTAPFSMGILSEQTLNSAIDMLNQIRYIAGLSHNVSLNDSYNTYAQAASLVNYVNNELDHYPSQPKGMNDSLYELGRIGAGSSNLGRGSRSIEEKIVYGWMADADSTNIDRVGHRRWILNPHMGATGFGAVSGINGTYFAVYAFDKSGHSTADYSVWPAQNMPLEYFNEEYPWSFSTGDQEDINTINVVLTRKKDNKTWLFSHIKSNGEFYVNNTGYGLTGCVIFKPDDIGVIQDGDSYTVKITGLKQGMISYEVNFFSVASTLKQVKNEIIVEKNGVKYVTDRHGANVTGYFTYDGKSYYAQTDSTLLCNDFTPDGMRYASADGSFVIGKFSVNGKTYITNEEGVLYGCSEIPIKYDGKYYYVKEDGSLACNELVEIKDGWITPDAYATFDNTLLTNTSMVYKDKKYYFDKRGYGSDSYQLVNKKSLIQYNVDADDKYDVYTSKNITIPKKVTIKKGKKLYLCNADIDADVEGVIIGGEYYPDALIGRYSEAVLGKGKNWNKIIKEGRNKGLTYFKVYKNITFEVSLKMNGKMRTYKIKVKVK